MLTGTQRPFGPERFEAKPSRFATPEDPVQIDAGGEVIDIVVDLEQPQGGDDVRQVGLGLFQPRPILRNGITDAVGFLRRMVIAWGSAMPTFWRRAVGLAPRAKVSLLHNAGIVQTLRSRARRGLVDGVTRRKGVCVWRIVPLS